jgi:hypothetical protein
MGVTVTAFYLVYAYLMQLDCVLDEALRQLLGRQTRIWISLDMEILRHSSTLLPQWPKGAPPDLV